VIPYTEHMHQCGTYWPPGGNDGFGGQGQGKPMATACRWQNVAQMFRTPEGRESVSQAVVYTGKLLLGESDARTPPAEALEIRQVDTSPNLDGTQQLTKAYL
jgi:hypothetical protein